MTGWLLLAVLAAEPGYGPPVDTRVVWVNLAPTLVGLTTHDALISLGVELPLSERLEGAGLVWNVGQPPVEGYTNLLYVLLGAA